MTLRELEQMMTANPAHWQIPLMDFVDEFRRMKSPASLQEPLGGQDERFDALLASTIEYLCAEQGVSIPAWVWQVPACRDPWFVSGVENLKATALVESPVYFRRRKIFVLENFLDRC